MSRIFSYLAILALLSIPAQAQDHGTFTAFRWNQGFRAEREPLLEQAMSEKEFREVVGQGKLPAHEHIYRGCYLVHFQPGKAARALASEAKPVTETYRVCVPNKNPTPAASPLSANR